MSPAIPKSAITVSVVALFVSGLAVASVVPANDAASAVSMPAHPQRIVSLGLHQDELVLALAPERVVALDAFADDAQASFVVAEAAAVAHRVTATTESILREQPDLVLLPGWASFELQHALEAAGVAVHREPVAASVAGIRESIVRLGAVLDARARAAALLARFDRDLAEVRARPPMAPRPEVLLLAATGTSAGRGTLFAELVELAGGSIALSREGIVPLPLESVLRIDPDWILIDDYRADGRARSLGDSAVIPQSLAVHLRAHREGRMTPVAPRLANTTSHHVVETAQVLAELFRRR